MLTNNSKRRLRAIGTCLVFAIAICLSRAHCPCRCQEGDAKDIIRTRRLEIISPVSGEPVVEIGYDEKHSTGVLRLRGAGAGNFNEAELGSEALAFRSGKMQLLRLRLGLKEQGGSLAIGNEEGLVICVLQEDAGGMGLLVVADGRGKATQIAGPEGPKEVSVK